MNPQLTTRSTTINKELGSPSLSIANTDNRDKTRLFLFSSTRNYEPLKLGMATCILPSPFQLGDTGRWLPRKEAVSDVCTSVHEVPSKILPTEDMTVKCFYLMLRLCKDGLTQYHYNNPVVVVAPIARGSFPESTCLRAQTRSNLSRSDVINYCKLASPDHKHYQA